MRIAVCSPQVPFARGGAEILAERLTEELQTRGHEADLDEVDGRTVDLVIGTKFPSYVVRHPNKVVWLVHQFRQAYELDRTDLGQFDESPQQRALRRKLHDLDRIALGEARRLCTISQNVTNRLRANLGLDSEVVLPPPQALDFHCEEYGDFILSVNRLDRAKRIDLLLDAAKQQDLEVVVAGDGPDRPRLEALADGRVRFAGRVSEQELADLYARCRAVYYAPVDEDYGMVPYEAFLSGKPVVTTTDAGGPLDVVSDRRTGLVVEPRIADLGVALRYLVEHEEDARAWGAAGKQRAEQVTWDHAVERLLAR